MRKTSKLRKLFALALCLVMACSMSIGAFAAEISDVEYTQKSGNCEVVTIDLDDVLAIAEEFNPNARSISLPASTYKMYDIGTLSAGQSVVINVVWTPGTSPIHIGLVKSTSSTGNLVSLTGGSKSITANVSSAGTYYLMIANPSSTTNLTISTLSYAK